MNFAELRFWELLLSGLAIIAFLRLLLSGRPEAQQQSFDKLALLALGWVLLIAVSWLTFVIYMVVSLVTWFGLGWIQKHHPHHALKYLGVLIPLQLAPLFYYKYADFVANGVLGLDLGSLHGLLIPVGISFYSFQLAGFAIDTLVFKHPRPRLVDGLNFAGFFPQLVAGPIERRGDLLPQMERFRFRWLPRDIDEGAGWIVVGLFFKCCLADNLAGYFNRSPADTAYQVWLANVLFGLRIYYDFAGYSLIAVGLGRALGVGLTLNFTSPYCATDIGEFWRRWHITLSQWFRDYVYVPLGGGRVRHWAFNIALVFVVSGAWHGAGWNFILWGAMHALFLIVARLAANIRLPAFPAWLLTMLATFMAWLCFYEVDTTRLLAKLTLLFTPSAYSAAAWGATVGAIPAGDRIVLAGLLALVASTLVAEWLSIRRLSDPYAYLRRKPAVVGLVILTMLLAPGRNNGFIYFAF
jgi:alginate O-acetyltransferase complex protein AlgI